MARKQTKPATKRVTKRLSAPGTASRLYKLLNDPEQPQDALVHAHGWLDQLLNDAGVSFDHPAFFTRGFLMACRKIEATKRPKLSTKHITLWSAHQAYERVHEILTRVAQGETLADLHAEYERQVAERQVELKAEQARIDENSDHAADEAVHEAELLARVLEHPDTPPHVTGAIRFLMIGACKKISDHLKDHDADADLIRDIYPYARLVCAQPMREAFAVVVAEIERDAPGVLNAIEAQEARLTAN